MRTTDVPPEQHKNARFMVGRDENGLWVVTDRRRLCGGIFSDRPAAVHYAMEESGYNPGDVCAAPEGVTLTLDSVFSPPGLVR